jgi:hypothetical protein
MLFHFLMIVILSVPGLNLGVILTCISFITKGVENFSKIYWFPFLLLLIIVGSDHFPTDWFISLLNAFWTYYMLNLCGTYQDLYSIQVKKTVNFVFNKLTPPLTYNIVWAYSIQAHTRIAVEFLSYIDVSVTCATGTSFKYDVPVKVLLYSQITQQIHHPKLFCPSVLQWQLMNFCLLCLLL